MCGIAGAFGLTDEAVQGAVSKMSNAQFHRGPDSGGLWVSPGNVVLAHRRLSILDLSDSGAQPMVDPRNGNAIVYNGEVYNFRELRKDLQSLGHSFTSDCDTEVILKAYGQWGISCVERLRGMFAFAIFDAASGSVYLARDRVGIKPLYYTEVTGTRGGRVILFASEVRALLSSGLVDKKIDPVGLSSYLWSGFVNGPETIVKGVNLLPAGAVLTIGSGSTLSAPEPFWSYPHKSDVAASSIGDVRNCLEESVKMRLISDVPVGVFLSGGIDSSAVAALAMKAGQGSINTFNVGFDQAEFNESMYAEAVAKSLGTEHTTVNLTEAMFQGQIDDALNSLDQPTFDGINTYFVSRAVKEAGITVALAGTGGDELFGGYTSFSDLPKAQKVARALSMMPAGLRDSLAVVVGRLMGRGGAGGVADQTRWGKLRDVLSTEGDLINLYQVSYALFTQEFSSTLKGPLLSGVAGETPFGLSRAAREQLQACGSGSSLLHDISVLELGQFIGQRLMRDTDAASMAPSLEVRVPLLDHKLIETVAGMDDMERYHPVGRKQALIRSALKDMDPALFDRPKSGFVLPIEDWLSRGLGARVSETLNSREACERVGLEVGQVSNLWRAFQGNKNGIYWSRPWSLFVLIDWCQRQGLSL